MKSRNNYSPVTVEVLRSNELEAQPRPRTKAEALEILVQQKVAEILADRDEFVFEPWFRTRQVSYEIRRLQSVPDRKKWARYFELYGCLVCQSRERSHGSKGLCDPCHALIFNRLKALSSELMNERNRE